MFTLNKFGRGLAAIVVIPFIALITLLSGLILVLATPPVWEPIYDYALSDTAISQAAREDAQQISRGFWNGASYAQINEKFTPIKLGPREIKHFEDVRNLVHILFYPLIVGTLVLLTWVSIFKQTILWNWSLIYTILLTATIGIWGLIAWRHMFRTLHWWIFQNDSWILPSGCYSLRLYPYAVWQHAIGAVFISLLIILMALSLPGIVKGFLARKSLGKRA